MSIDKNKSPHAPAALLSWLALLACATPAAAEPTPRDLQAARCVAALEVLAEDLAREARVGNAAARSALMDRLVAAATFVGEAYLRGTADEAQAKAAHRQAREAQKKLSPAQLTERQALCAQEGAALYQSANAFQQYVVRRTAQRRMDKLLALPRAAQAGAGRGAP